MISDNEPSVAPQTPLPVWAAEAVDVPEPEGTLGFMGLARLKEEGKAAPPGDYKSVGPLEPEVSAPASDAHNMNWAGAQACLCRGQKVRRNGWGADADWLELDFDGAVMIKRRGTLWPYPQPVWDTDATDWQVVG